MAVNAAGAENTR